MRGYWRAALLFATLFVAFLPQWVAAEDQSLEQVRTYVEDYYVDQVDASVLGRDSIKEIMAGLDQYSVYFTPQEFSSFVGSIDRAMSGIGVSVAQHESGLMLLEVFESTPAAKAGLKASDVITTVDGVTLAGKSMEEATSLLAGEAGTTVNVTVQRPGSEARLSFTIVRDKITIPTVESTRLGGNIGYFHLYSFNEHSAQELKQAMETLGPVKHYIVDIRDNGGGYLNAAQEVAGLFPGVMEVMMTEDSTGFQDILFSTKQDKTLNAPAFLVVNNQSASASEVLAAAVKEQGEEAAVYGTQTFGKGTVQTIFPLDNGGVIKLTVARFFSPEGKPIDQVGVTPDVETAPGKELDIAHRDALIKTNGLETTTVDKKTLDEGEGLAIVSKEPANWSLFSKEKVSLVKLGGKDTAFTLEPLSLSSLAVIPETKLSESDYFLGVEGEKAAVIDVKSPTTQASGRAPFLDVKDGRYFTDAIRVLANEKMIIGTGNQYYQPGKSATRAEVAKMLANALKLKSPEVRSSRYADVKSTSYYADELAALVEHNVLNGNQRYFRPDDTLSRGDLAVWIQKAFDLNRKGSAPFRDILPRSPYESAVNALYGASIVNGTGDGEFSPRRSVSRGEAAAMLYRALSSQASAPAITDIRLVP
ncbi:S41 family peptidase [Aureibacillus halotolerans]|uniref:C-terminal peptidase prc n=1 Tax=Aureibacillus halotolerans TaxID=1508390 RepID=A0A4R6TTB8_9BACI|nr:S41 family peptidase [Aureibacillus halotolerans]TDQ36910.1 C-terminal peptidase prc [Aureibacillus halotolerans]